MTTERLPQIKFFEEKVRGHTCAELSQQVKHGKHYVFVDFEKPDGKMVRLTIESPQEVKTSVRTLSPMTPRLTGPNRRA